jgi:hypothetical protein
MVRKPPPTTRPDESVLSLVTMPRSRRSRCSAPEQILFPPSKERVVDCYNVGLFGADPLSCDDLAEHTAETIASDEKRLSYREIRRKPLRFGRRHSNCGSIVHHDAIKHALPIKQLASRAPDIRWISASQEGTRRRPPSRSRRW